jgi:hypothetical protein
MAAAHGKRIAVLAVHGVGDQAPMDSARKVADLLASLEREGRVQYTPMHEEALHVPVRPMWAEREAPDDGDSSLSGRLRSALAGDQRRASYTHPRTDARTAGPRRDLSLELMDEQLRGYERGGPSATLQTLRLKSVRRASRAAGEAEDLEVDVYEMFWADLSRPGTTFTRIGAELYQLFFHLANLGALLLDNQAARFRGAWQVLSDRHAMAVSLITNVVPVLNLLAMATMLLLPIANVPQRAAGWIAPVALALIAAVAADRGVGRRSGPPTVRRLILHLSAGLAAGASAGLAAWWLIGRFPRAELGSYVLATLWIAAAFLVGRRMMRAWDRHQPGVADLAGLLAALWLLAAMYGAWWAFPQYAEGHKVVALAGRRTADALLASLSVAWMATLALATWLWARGAWLSRGTADSPARRTVVTARATLALTATGVLLVTLLAWGIAHAAFQAWIPQDVFYPGMDGLPRQTMDKSVNYLLGHAATIALLPVVMLVAVALILMLWSVLPVVITEVWPPRPTSSPRDERAAQQMGERLTLAYRAARVSGIVLSAAMTVFLLGLLFQWAVGLGVVPKPGWYDRWMDQAREVLVGAVALLGVSTVGLVALRGKLDRVALGLRTALDIALDVDNYLRLHPKEATPRARIVERYSSLLAYLLGSPRGPGASPRYDALVVVAHSQGTIITADLLRYARNRDLLAANLGFDYDEPSGEWSAPVPVHLFTMGCPLRQLYQLRFPALYDWLGNASGRDRRTLDATAEPTLAATGVSSWYNVYRSGDYVGRQLWLDDAACPLVYRRVDPAGGTTAADALVYAATPDDAIREACIGAGAHTHYWDDTAPEVARLLDELIVRAARSGGVVGGELPAPPRGMASPSS